jgi:signal transduction histidine kinase
VIAVGLVLLLGLVAAWVLSETWRVFEHRDREHWRRQAAQRTDRLARDLAGRGALFEPTRGERYALLEAVRPRPLASAPRLDASCADWRLEFGTPATPCESEATRFCAPAAAAESVDALPCESAFAHFERLSLLAASGTPAAAETQVFSLGVGRQRGDLYLFLRVVDDPPRTEGAWAERDRLGIVVSVPGGGGTLLPARFAVVLEPDGRLSTAPARRGFERRLESRARGSDEPAPRRPEGAWRVRDEGWELELRLPLSGLGIGEAQLEAGPAGLLGLALLDVDAAGPHGETLRQRAIWLAPRVRRALSWRAPAASSWDAATADLDGRKLAVLDRRLLELHASFDPNGSSIAALRDEAASLLRRLGAGTATAEADRLLAAARVDSPAGDPLGFVLEAMPPPPASPDAFAALRGSPLLGAAIVACVALLLALLLYTGRLSQRILALVDDPGSQRDADDEIGALSRQFSGLLRRVRSHRDYLAHLPRTLRHEVVGPLNVVTMFLGNAEPSEDRLRARDAVRRIESLINDLADARSLEEALGHGDRLDADVIELLRRHLDVYQRNGGAPLDVALPEAGFPAVVIEGRVEEMLDKLLDNALDFSEATPVRVTAAARAGQLRIRVENRGPPLPEDVEALFEPLCSRRGDRSDRHLGLGLYVARVIAEHHRGGLRAWNEVDGRVVFEVTLRGVDVEGTAPDG